MKRTWILFSCFILLAGYAFASGFHRGSGFHEGVLEMSDYPILFDESESDPGVPISDEIQLYAKDKAGVTTLYTQDASGTVSEVGAGGSGTGDVIGPTTNTDGYIPQWDGANSKTLKNGIPASTFLTSLSGAVLTDQSTPQTIGATGARLTKLWATDIQTTNKIVAPGIAPASDGTTAIQLTKANGTNILNVDTTNGLVGIGTTAPAGKIHVVPEAGSSAVLIDRIGDGSGSEIWGLGIKNAAANDTVFLGQSSSSYAGTLQWLPASSSALYYGSSFNIGTGTGTTPVINFSSTGTIGIGISALSTAKMNISTPAGYQKGIRMGPGTATLNDGAYIEFATSSDDGYGPQIGGIRTGAGALGDLIIKTGGNAQQERFRVTDGGNVGIGTATPYAYDTTVAKFGVVGPSTAGEIEVAAFMGGSDANDSYGLLRVTNVNDRGIFLKGGRAADASKGVIGLSEYNGARTDYITMAGGSLTVNGNISATNLSGTNTGDNAANTSSVAKSTYDANTVLYATTDDTPAALTVGEQTAVGRTTGGAISAIPIDSDLAAVSANDDTIPSAKAVNSFVDARGFVDRGDPTGVDVTVSSLTTDGTWRDLDLSAIVPAGAKGIIIKVGVTDDAAVSVVQFRKNGNANAFVTAVNVTQVANVPIQGLNIVACDSGRVIEYMTTNTTFTTINITVMGWFM